MKQTDIDALRDGSPSRRAVISSPAARRRAATGAEFESLSPIDGRVLTTLADGGALTSTRRSPPRAQPSRTATGRA